MSANEQSTGYIMGEKLKKVEELRQMGIEPYGRFFDKKDSIQDILNNKDDMNRVFITAGRIVSYRRMGKNGFAHLKDSTGKNSILCSKRWSRRTRIWNFQKFISWWFYWYRR